MVEEGDNPVMENITQESFSGNCAFLREFPEKGLKAPEGPAGPLNLWSKHDTIQHIDFQAIPAFWRNYGNKEADLRQ